MLTRGKLSGAEARFLQDRLFNPTFVPGHCQTCIDYEAAVMDGESADSLAPCDGYNMTSQFRDWMVNKMRDEVLGQISGAGLDRMAIIKSKEDQ
jgi:hypothetical protein